MSDNSAIEPKTTHKRQLFSGTVLVAVVFAYFLINVMPTTQSPESHYEEVESIEIDQRRQVHYWFWWGCPHCYEFDSKLQDWASARDVEIVRMPVLGTPERNIHAALFLTLKERGLLALQDEFFSLVQSERRPQQRMREVLRENGEDPDVFFNDFVQNGSARVREHAESMKHHRIEEVPALVVGDRYRILGKTLKSYDEILVVAEELLSGLSPESLTIK